MVDIERVFHVKLRNYTEDPERTCAVAAMFSVNEKVDDETFTNVDYEKAMRILRNVVARGHHSVLEHASFTFNISGVSRALTHQLVRHRIASYTQQSQRYVKLKEIEFIKPDTIASNEEFNKRYDSMLEKISELYIEMVNAGIPKEDARYILPNATPTSIIVTMNARELLHFFSLRTCYRAQWEIRRMAEEMLRECKKVAPVIFEKAGPPCIRGPCPEGKYTCGKPRNNEPLFMS
ncbi:MAG: FAD-dependent thymidylate synthase [Candidatus Diapherotrites archaeon]|nr:FAD-dependent thymidylate synthase [Candidatus Diapherotrites archaeon]